MSNDTEAARYTLNEAQRVFALRECDQHGHEWTIVSSLSGGPTRIICDRCGWFGDVTMSERPSA